MWRVVPIVFAFACAEGGVGDTDTDGGSSGYPVPGGEATTGADEETPPPGTTEVATTDWDPAESGGEDPPDPPGGSSGGDEDVGSAGCGIEALEAGMHPGLTIEWEGVERKFDVLVPETYDPNTPATLVFNFHGLLSDPFQQQIFSQMNEHAEEAGAIVVYPVGVGASWNGGTCCGDATTQEVDDVGFARAVVEEVSSMLCVAPRRVFATGMSNGAFMSHRLACEAGDVFAAISPVAGVIGVPMESCSGRAVPVLHFHGTADILVPYEGGGATESPSVDETIDFWVDHNGCTTGPDVTFTAGSVTCETWSGCTDDADVTKCRIENGGHCWPGNLFCPTGFSTVEIHASQAALEFFDTHPMP